MVTISRLERLTLPLATAVAALAGGTVALLFLVMPSSLLEGAVSASGIPAVLAAAEPPLGFTARIALGLLFGGAVAAFAWFGLTLVAGRRLVSVASAAALLRRLPGGEPPRPPLFANRDLGTPFLDVKAPASPAASPVASSGAARHANAEDYAMTPLKAPVEQPLPGDLDQPLAAFDPAAIRPTPLTPSAPVVPLTPSIGASRPQLIDPGDRFETFELTPVTRPAPPSLRAPAAPAAPLPEALSPARAVEPQPAPEPAPEPVVTAATETSIQAMLARLERGIGARVAPAITQPEPKRSALEDTLGDLRRLATSR